MDDRDLVSALRSGDVRGLAGVYDRYADRLVAYAVTMLRDPDAGADAVHDALLVARERVGQLRDPDKLRPWLYAIVRTECLRQLRDRRRAAPLEAAGEVIDQTAEDPGRDARADELRELVWAAAAALNPGEREVLELSVRHGLEGAELAAALGVAVNAAHAQSSRARAQLERSLGALLVARTGGRDCPQLAGLLAGWDGTLTPLLRKRLARHADRCEVCGETRRTRLTPVALLAGVPFLPAPAGLRERVLREVASTQDLSGQDQPGHDPSGPGQPGPGRPEDRLEADLARRDLAGRDRAGRDPTGRALAGGALAGGWRWRADGFPVAPDQRRVGTWRWSAAAVAVLAALLVAGLLLRPGSAPVTAAEQMLPPVSEAPATVAGTLPATTGAPTAAPTPTPTVLPPAGTTATTPVPAATPPPVPSATPTATPPPPPPPVTTTRPAPPTTTTVPPPPPPPPPAAPEVTTRWALAAPACPQSWRARLTATVTGTTATSVLATYGAARGLAQTAAMTSAGRGVWTVVLSLPAGTDLTWTATASTGDGRIRSAAQPLRHDCLR